MAKESVNEAALQMVESLRQANEAIAQSVIAAEARNAQFAQNIFSSGVEILKSHAHVRQAFEQQMQKQQENVRRLVQELEQQTQKQQEAFQKLMQASMEAFKNLPHPPLS